MLNFEVWVGAATVFTLSDVDLVLDWRSASFVESGVLLAQKQKQKQKKIKISLTFRERGLAQGSDHGVLLRTGQSRKGRKQTGYDGSRIGRRRQLLPCRRFWDQGGGLRNQYLPVRRSRHLSVV